MPLSLDTSFGTQSLLVLLCCAILFICVLFVCRKWNFSFWQEEGTRLFVAAALAVVFVFLGKGILYDRPVASSIQVSVTAEDKKSYIVGIVADGSNIPLEQVIPFDKDIFTNEGLLITQAKPLTLTFLENNTIRIYFKVFPEAAVIQIKDGMSQTQLNLDYEKTSPTYIYTVQSNSILWQQGTIIICLFSLLVFLVLWLLCWLILRLHPEPRAFAFIFSIVYYILSAIQFRHYVFNDEYLHNKDVYFLYNICQFIALAIYIFIAQFVVFYFQKWQATGFPRGLYWKISVCFSVIIFILAVVLWPGEYLWDDYWLLNAVLTPYMYAWQHILTYALQLLFILLLPSPAGPLLIQLAISVIIFTYICYSVEKILGASKWNWLLLIPFLLPPILKWSFSVFRSVLYAYLFVLLIVKLFMIKSNHARLTPANTVLIGLLIGILSVWRTEGIYLALLIPLTLFFTLKEQRVVLQKSLATLIGISILLVITSYQSEYSANEYTYTAIINPISNMLQYDLSGKTLTTNLAKIDAVLNLDVMQENYAIDEIPAFWEQEEALINYDATEAEISDLYKGYLGLVIDNFPLFLKVRLQTYLSAAGIPGYLEQINPTMAYTANDTTVFTFRLYNKYPEFAPLFGPNTRQYVDAFLSGHNMRSDNPTIIYYIFWTLPYILFPVINTVVIIISLIKRKWFLLFIELAMMGNLVLIFLTEPANYFIYFITYYLTMAVTHTILLQAWIRGRNHVREGQESEARK